MELLKIRNWDKYQDYEQENPPWIKIYTKILQDYEFMNLPDTEKAAFFLILCYAAKTENQIPNDDKFLTSLFCMDDGINLQLLCDKGFLVTRDIERDVTPLSQKIQARNRKRKQRQRLKGNQCHKDVTPMSRKETETETETEKKEGGERLAIPLKNGSEFIVESSHIEELKNAYKDVDVETVLQQIKLWNIDNSQKRKTPGGIRSHISKWMKKEQELADNKKAFGKAMSGGFTKDLKKEINQKSERTRHEELKRQVEEMKNA